MKAIDDCTDLVGVTIVVVGHNESKNLTHSFQAIKSMCYPQDLIEIVYVDSNSTDSSVEIALLYADRCISIDSSYPSAGEAFNVGIAAAKHEYVWITGGDIALDPVFLAKAIKRLLSDLSIAAVTGYWDEKDSRGINRLLGYVSLEHNRGGGEFYVNAPNGSVFRKSVLQHIDGYDERINKGQETELGMRLLNMGMKILHMNIPQGLHDYDTHSFLHLSVRYFNEGKSSCRVMLLRHDSSSVEYYSNARKSAYKRLFGFSILIALLSAASILGYFYLSLYVCAILTLIILMRLTVRASKGKKSSGYIYFRVISFLFEPVRYFGMLYLILKVTVSKKCRSVVVCSRCGLSGLDRLNAKIIMVK